MSIKNIELQYSDLKIGGSSHKIYIVRLEKSTGGYLVNFQYGRIGGRLNDGTKTPSAVSFEEATVIFDRLVDEKLRKGYMPPKDGKAAPTSIPVPAGRIVGVAGLRTPYPIEDLEEIEEHESTVYVHSPKYWLQKKNNGEFRQVQKLADGTYLGFNKLGNLVNSLPSEVVDDLRKLKAKTFFGAGELIGNKWIVENLLELNGGDLSRNIYGERFAKLECLIPANATHVTVTQTWRSLKEKLQGVAILKKTRAEGEVYKLITAIYRPGATGQHRKHKYTKTASVIVIGLGHKGHNSATLALHGANGEIIEVGRCSLNGKPSVNIGTIVEVRYLYATEGRRLYQPRLERIRTDIESRKCTIAQLIYKEGVQVA